MRPKIRMRRGPRRLPRFTSDRQAARFFDTHDMADYWDQLEEVDEVIELAPALARKIRERMRKRLLAIRLEQWQIERAKKIARAKGVPYQTLMREWISRGIRTDGAKVRRAE